MNILKDNTLLVFRIVLFLSLLGHGLVNLGFSPSIALHENLIKATLPFVSDPTPITGFMSVVDFSFALLILFNIAPKFTLPGAFAYLTSVAIAGWSLYFDKTGIVFGFAEIMRRLPWIFFTVFLYLALIRKNNLFYLLRIGLSFAFLAHGTASMGILGLNQGHIELATQIIPEDLVRDFVFYSGISDGILGLMILTGILSRIAAGIGALWLIFVVYLSFSFAVPDGIFRCGFLLAAAYVAIDTRCHEHGLIRPGK